MLCILASVAFVAASYTPAAPFSVKAFLSYPSAESIGRLHAQPYFHLQNEAHISASNLHSSTYSGSEYLKVPPAPVFHQSLP